MRTITEIKTRLEEIKEETNKLNIYREGFLEHLELVEFELEELNVEHNFLLAALVAQTRAE